jgi:hypothetical protein
VHVNKHVVPAVALLVVVAEAAGGVPGTTHLVWQFAAWALQFIMQFVTVEVCASRILPAAVAPWAIAPCATAALIAAAARTIAKLRMRPPPARIPIRAS